VKDWKTIHVLPEKYHGNPMSKKGSLVFYDFGWDILDLLKEAGFDDAYIVSYYIVYHGYLGDGLQFMIADEKKDS
jgi:hypothetical protein